MYVPPATISLTWSHIEICTARVKQPQAKTQNAPFHTYTPYTLTLPFPIRLHLPDSSLAKSFAWKLLA